jgi:hypothetical protein
VIAIKTIWKDETGIAADAFPDVIRVSGYATVWKLDRVVPSSCEGIVSLGLCTGLTPDVSIGQIMCASTVMTDKDSHEADKVWRGRISDRFGEVQPWYSSWDPGAANGISNKAALFRKSGAWCFDHETVIVAEFAKLRKIPFVVFRAVSTSWIDDVPNSLDFFNLMGLGIQVNAGAFDYASLAAAAFKTGEWAVLESTLATQYQMALAALRKAVALVGPNFCWEDRAS